MLIAAIGRWFGGSGRTQDLRECVVWSCIPFAVTGFLFLPEIVVYGPNAPIEMIVWWTVPLLLIALTGLAWALATEVIMVAEVHRSVFVPTSSRS